MKFRLKIGAVVAGLLLMQCISYSIAPQTARAIPISAYAEMSPSGLLRAPGQLMLKIRPALSVKNLTSPANVPEALQPLFSQLGVYGLKYLGGDTNILLLYISIDIEDALTLAGNEPLVEKADANYIKGIDQTIPATNDPLVNSGQQWWLDKVHGREAWTITTGSKAVKVGVVDSGIDANHPDLRGKVIAAYNFGDDIEQSTDEEGHGTAVAGCITANTNNGEGLSGLNWEVSLIDGKGFGLGYSFDLSRAVIYTIDKGARVVNNSWGGSQLSVAELAMLDYAYQKDVLLVFSSGNGSTSQISYPAGLSSVYPNLIAVGATDINDKVTGFSTFGPHVNIVAPGSGIWTTKSGGGYQGINGTSFSSPIVTGVAALMLSVNPNLHATDLRAMLEGTADDISGVGYTLKTGYGRVNAYKAVLAAQSGDTRPNKRSQISGKVSGVDLSKVKLSLDPFSFSFAPDASGNFTLRNLGKGTYRLRAAVPGQGTGQGVIEIALTGQADSVRQVNFSFQNLKTSAIEPDNLVDQARFFDARPANGLGTGSRYFPETGHSLDGIFRQYWEKNGGLEVFGYPLSERFVELSPTDGKVHTVQYFERNRFEWHPEFSGTKYEVLLGLLGSEQLGSQRYATQTPVAGARYFPETSQNLAGLFRQYWEKNGGLDLFGLPISPVLVENGYQVQYFERNRFELHPENSGTRYEVLLGLLGVRLAQARGYL